MIRKSKVLFDLTRRALHKKDLKNPSGYKAIKEKIKSAKSRRRKILNTPEKIHELVEENADIIMKISGVFPFDFFPDILVIDRNKISHIQKYFFLSVHVKSILIENIGDIIVETSPFFAALEIMDITFVHASIKLNYLKRKDAECARRIIQGLMICKNEGINLKEYKNNDLFEIVQQIGRIQGIESVINRH